MNTKDTNIAYLVIFLLGLLGLLIYFFIDNSTLLTFSLAFIFFGWFSMKLETIQYNVEFMRMAKSRQRHHDPNLDNPRVKPVNDIQATKRPPRYRSQ